MALIVDLSKYQDSDQIDWGKAKQLIDGLILRVQYGSLTLDKEYAKHVANAKKAGIPFMSYAYGHFVSIEDAKTEARDLIKRADKASAALILDVESLTLDSLRNKSELAAASQAYIDVLKAAGYKAGFYCSHNMYKAHHLDKVKADFLWLPRYGVNNGNKSTKPDWPCDLWQYTSKGNQPFYNGSLDLSDLNGNKGLDYFFGASKPKQETKPVNKPKPAAKVSALLKKGSKGSAVKSLQQDLIHAGYSVGKSGADGDFGPATEAAVRKLQQDYRIGVDGVVGPQTKSALSKALAKKSKPSGKSVVSYPGHVLKRGNRGKDVQRIQRALGITVDGIFGKQTEAAVKAYQKRHGLSIDGIVGKQTWNTLF
ncbi:peptidoglycan-binding protein [Sporolactobacillus terrae]|uniref:Peptidoglycan binding-like domain-containing protein n=1 Tax=Sporolactobacillus terrae TaxID=269673 RepID=A0A5K7WT48_9BACL|nr:peptidoglycan-binding protein [Sporolactobacillus terrae]BBN97517.1 hypothetical protein St703_02220 [Sporolactobacillus terrae]